MATYNKTTVTVYKLPSPPMIEGFPHLFNDVTIAHSLGLKNKTLWYLIDMRNKEKAYNCFGIPEYREDGSFKKKRYIQAPVEELKFAHKVFNSILSNVALPKSVSAYVKGKSAHEAANQHVRETLWVSDDKLDEAKSFLEDKRYKQIRRYDDNYVLGTLFYQPLVSVHLDIQNYFNTVRASWIRKFFYHEVGYTHYVSAILATFCTVRRTDKKTGETDWFLPQGSPLSGSLSNLVGYYRFGKKIEDYLKTESPDWVYTIYSDDVALTHPDLTISQEEVDRVKNNVVRIIQDAGFTINENKTKIRRSKNERIEVLGCVINEKLNLPRYIINNAKCLLHNCKVSGWESQKEVLGVQSDVSVIQYARGISNYVKQIRPDIGVKLQSDFEEALKLYPVTERSTHVITNEDIGTQEGLG